MPAGVRDPRTHLCSTAIGAFSDVVLRYFDWDKKEYLAIPVREQVEVASLVGDVNLRRASRPPTFIS
jgi:predicted DNA-binding protein with PD1-like motif